MVNIARISLDPMKSNAIKLSPVIVRIARFLKAHFDRAVED